MKEQILKFSLKDSHVIKSIVFIYILILAFGCKTNNNLKYNNSIDAPYYSVLNDIVLKDSISANQKEAFANYIKTKKYTEEQIEHYVEKTNKRRSHLFLIQMNNKLFFYINKELDKGEGQLTRYFGKEKLKQVLKNFPEEKMLDTLQLNNEIKFIKGKSEFGHLFSSPIFINNEMIIHYTNYVGKDNMFSYVYIFDITDRDNPKLIKRFYRTIS